MRKELFWDTDPEKVTAELEIERAINFGGFGYIEKLQTKYGLDKFREVIIKNRRLSRKAVNYWCSALGLDRDKTAAFSRKPAIWLPTR